MSPFEELIKYAVNLRFDDVPADVIHHVKRSLILTLGNCVRAARDSACERVPQFGFAGSGEAHSTALGLASGLPASWTAFINGHAFHQEHRDDYHRSSMVSPTSPVVATLIALTRDSHVTGRKFLVAFTLGAEIAVRTGMALGASHRRRGWYPTATAGYIGAIAGGAKIRQFDAQQFTNAFGLGSLATGTVSAENAGAMGLTVGLAAYNATNAVLLAESGFTSNLRAIEGVKGFLSVSSLTCNFEALTDGLYDTWNIIDSVPKPIPCQPELYPVLIAASLMGMRLKSEASEVLYLDVSMSDISVAWAYEASVESKSVLVDMLLRALRTAAVPNFNSSTCGQKTSSVHQNEEWPVRFHKGDELSPLQARVTATLSDGRILAQEVNDSHSAYLDVWASPSDDELSRTFTEQVSRYVNREQANSLLDSLWNLEEVGDLTELFTR